MGNIVKEKELTISATKENYNNVVGFLEDFLMEANAPFELTAKLSIVLDELYSNIMFYAYGGEPGDFIFRVQVDSDNIFTMKFIDNGVPFDPLARDDPDIHESVEDRGVGGLGIFMVKNLMDTVSYEYVNKQNVLTLTKQL